MVEIPEPPNNRDACASCMSPLRWFWSPRTNRWIAFVGVDTTTLRLHECRSGLTSRTTWRDLPRPDPGAAERAHRGAQLAREILARRTHPDGGTAA